MKTGKVSESILKRSVLRECIGKREEVIIGAGLGEDCAVLQFKEEEELVLSTNPAIKTYSNYEKLAVYKAVNNIAATGAEPVGILVNVLLPVDTEEEALKEIMRELSSVCDTLGIQILGGHTEVTDAVVKFILTITGIGKLKKGMEVRTGGAKPGQDIVVSKWIGLAGSSILAKERKEKLRERYAERFIREAEETDDFLSVLPEAEIASDHGVSSMHDISEGGIFSALWDMATASNVGLEVELKSIPIRQETVEICNFFDVNPYEFLSAGSLLMVTDNGEELVTKLKEEGIPATLIGRTTDGNDRVILNEEERRFLEPPRQNESYKVFFGKESIE